MSLNSEQLDLRKKLQNFITSERNGFFGVLGSGGTGKTFTVCQSIDVNNAIFLGATNKVCGNLRDELSVNYVGFKVKTIDSFFKFKMRKDENNKTVITNKMPLEKDIPNVIVIDEVSLINKRTYELIMKLKDKRKIILIGDNMQIPPIEDKDNVVRDRDGFQVSRIFLNIDEMVTLTIQMRQKNGSGIGEYISNFRKHMGKEFNLHESIKQHQNGKDILLLDIHSNELKDIIEKDNPIAVCYKNITCLSYNYKAGNILVGKDYKVNDLNVGDVVFFDSFYNDGTDRFYTSDVVTILNIEKDVEDEIHLSDDEVANVTYDKVTIDHEGFDSIVKVSSGYYETIRPVYYRKNKLIKKSNDKDYISNLHTLYHDYQLSFAKFKKPFAITSHKAQGSTFGTVIIPLYDFAAKYHKDRNQLFYVAISRAKDKLVFTTAPSNFKDNSDRYNFYEIERCGIASSQDWKCKVCETELFDREYDIDHIIPLKERYHGDLKGRNDLNNLQALCKDCHKSKTYSNERAI